MPEEKKAEKLQLKTQHDVINHPCDHLQCYQSSSNLYLMPRSTYTSGTVQSNPGKRYHRDN